MPHRQQRWWSARETIENTMSKNSKAGAGLAAASGYAPLLILPTDTPTGTVDDVRAAGYVPVLTDEPDKVKLVLAGSEISGSDMLMAAMHGLNSYTGFGDLDKPKTQFLLELHRRLLKREGA